MKAKKSKREDRNRESTLMGPSKKDKMKICSFFKSSKVGNKGFSLVGVMVASAIGLIVVTSITHLFIQMSSRLTQLEQKQKRMMFYDYLINHFSNSTSCLNTLGPHGAYSAGNTWDVPGLKTNSDSDFTDAGELDFYSSAGKKRLKDDFGIGQFNKLEYRHRFGTPPESTLTVVTLGHIQGQIPVYNRPLEITLTITGDITTCQYFGHSYP